MFIVKFILNFIGALNKNASPSEVAAGMALGAIPGFTPTGSLHNAVIFALLFFIKINKASVIFTFGLFSLFAYYLDPLFNRIGQFLLVDVRGLHPLWTTLYNTPVVPWTRFNNTLTLGSFVFSVVMFLPIFFLARAGVVRYRETFLARMEQWKVVKILKASKLFALYRRFS